MNSEAGPCVGGDGGGTCAVELSGAPKVARQGRLQHHHEVLQLLCHAHQQILVDQVVLGLLQGPPAPRVPGETQSVTTKPQV